MGISIVTEIDPAGIRDLEWEAVYEQTLELIHAFEFMDEYNEKGKYGSGSTMVLDRSRERELPDYNGEIGWRTFGDLKTMGQAEEFILFRDMEFNKIKSDSKKGNAVDRDIYLTRVVDSELFEAIRDRIPKRTFDLFNAKTQGQHYHNYILAVALLIESRFPESVIIYGDVTRGQMKAAVKWANSVLEKPIQLPDKTDDERLFNRINKQFEDEFIVMSVFSELTMSDKNSEYGQFLRNHFNEETLRHYFTRDFKSFTINTLGLIGATSRYLNMGFSLKSLCQTCVNDQDGPGYDTREFIKFILNQKFHLKEPTEISSLRQYFELSTFNSESESPDTVESLFAKTLFKLQGLNTENSLYIPLDKIKKTFLAVFDQQDVEKVFEEVKPEDDAYDYPEEVISKASNLLERRDTSSEIYDFDTLVQWQPGVTIAEPIRKVLTTIRQSAGSMDELLPKSYIAKLKKTMSVAGYEQDAPLFFIFKDRFNIKKSAWDYFLKHATDHRVNQGVIALIMLEAIKEKIDSSLNAKELIFPLINNPELFEYVFISREFEESS